MFADKRYYLTLYCQNKKTENGETPKIYYNRNSKNKLSLLGSKAQEAVHSEVGCRQEPGGGTRLFGAVGNKKEK